MTTFIGDYHCKLDSKGRLMLPAVFKKQLAKEAGDRFVAKKDIFEKCLVLYPMDEWEIQNKIIRSKINPYKKEHNEFLRGFYRGMAELELDSSNRLLIPKRLLDEVGIAKDIVLAGQDGRIELWPAEQYDKMGISEQSFADLAEKIMGNGPLNNMV